MFVVALTGGIASGKTAVSNLFANLGIPVIDTDLIAHQIVQPGEPALKKIRKVFGQEFLDKEGRLKRRKMREAIFADPLLKTRLENILHPAIADEALRLVSVQKGPWCLLVVPLLAESGRYDWIDRIVVVDIEETVQIKRVMARDDISKTQALAIQQAQASRQVRLALADDVIDNNGSLEQLETQVAQLHKKYSTLAQANQPT